MIIKVKDDRKLSFLNVCSVAKYLGHFCTDDLSDDKVIVRQCRKLYARGNTLVRKFICVLQRSRLTCLGHIVLPYTLPTCGLTIVNIA